MMKRKFKFGDNVYVKAYLKIDCVYGQVFKYDDNKQMYVLILFDAYSPTSSWWWSYAKEDDIELLEKIDGKDNYYDRHKPLFSEDTCIYPAKYGELYTDDYYLAKRVTDGEITREEYNRQTLERFTEKTYDEDPCNGKKFKFGDNVYIKAYLKTSPKYAMVFKYSEKKQEYVIIRFDTNRPGNRHLWWWSYAKEEDIDFLYLIKGENNHYDKQKPLYPKTTELVFGRYIDLYTHEYYLAKKFSDGEITKEEYEEKLREYEESLYTDIFTGKKVTVC